MQSVLKAFRVLEAVGDARRPMGVGELSRLLELPKSTVQRNLETLEQAGWTRQDHTGGATRWTLTFRVLSMGRNLSVNRQLRTTLLPYVQRIANETDENTHVSVRNGEVMIVIERISSTHPVQAVLDVGEHLPLLTTASGQALLAAMEAGEVNEILHASHDVSAAMRKQILAEIDEVKVRGYAQQSLRFRAGASAVSAPILSRSGEPLAALSISAPTVRMPPEVCERWGALLADTATEIRGQL